MTSRVSMSLMVWNSPGMLSDGYFITSVNRRVSLVVVLPRSLISGLELSSVAEGLAMHLHTQFIYKLTLSINYNK